MGTDSNDVSLGRTILEEESFVKKRYFHDLDTDYLAAVKQSVKEMVQRIVNKAL